jgi:hypothetical protein
MTSLLFEYGEISVTCFDDKTKQVALGICAPLCIVQLALPLLLKSGFIDNFRVRNPLIAWLPVLSKERFTDKAISEVPNIDEQVKQVVNSRIIEMLQLFNDISSILKNPDDILTLLPFGIYIKFQFRSTLKEVCEFIYEFNKNTNPGVKEFCYSIAAELSQLLISIGSTENLEFYGVPSLT